MTTATTSPQAIVRSYLESFATGEPTTIASHVAPDFVNEHTAGLGSGCRGRDTYEQRLAGFLRDMQDLTYEIEHLVAADSDELCQVAVFYRMTAKWQGTAPFSVRGAQRLTVEGDLITHRTDYWDSAVFLAQVDDDARSALSAMGIVVPEASD